MRAGYYCTASGLTFGGAAIKLRVTGTRCSYGILSDHCQAQGLHGEAKWRWPHRDPQRLRIPTLSFSKPRLRLGGRSLWNALVRYEILVLVAVTHVTWRQMLIDDYIQSIFGPPYVLLASWKLRHRHYINLSIPWLVSHSPEVSTSWSSMTSGRRGAAVKWRLTC